MPDGGWNMCPSSMTGIVFGVYTTSSDIGFVEAMAFSQEAIQMNALSWSFLGTNDAPNLASNAI
jgi:hypothetical protein